MAKTTKATEKKTTAKKAATAKGAAVKKSAVKAEVKNTEPEIPAAIPISPLSFERPKEFKQVHQPQEKIDALGLVCGVQQYSSNRSSGIGSSTGFTYSTGWVLGIM